MEIVLILIGLIVLFLVVVNYMRKLHLDAIHFNLLELVEAIDGQVMRRGILSRPVYHGKYKGNDLTINFSSERSQKKRREYIDISLSKNLKNNLTISTREWIENRNEGSLEDFESIEIDGRESYVIRNSAKANYLKKNQDDKFKSTIKALSPFSYIFCGQNGLIFERECENLAMCTKHPQLEDTIISLHQLTQILL